MNRASAGLGAGALALVAAGAVLSAGPPRLVALNAALRVEYPWPRAAGAGAAAAGGVLLLALLKPWWVRAAGALVAVAGLGAALHLALYRVEADGRGLSSRGLLGTTHLSWREVDRVDGAPGLLLVSGRGTVLRVDTTDFRPEQRAALDRTVARRLREPAGP